MIGISPAESVRSVDAHATGSNMRSLSPFPPRNAEPALSIKDRQKTCHAIVKTRSTQSTSRVFGWFLHGYHAHQPVAILWDPAGSRSTDIKIACESIWLRYDTDRLVLSLAWVLAFGALYVYSHRRLEYF